MATPYWTLDIYDEKGNLIKKGDIIYANEIQATLKKRDLEDRNKYVVKIIKQYFDF